MSAENEVEKFRVPANSSIVLSDWPTDIPELSGSKIDYVAQMEDYQKEISKIQSKLYAHNRYSILMIFQGMDTAGKGGAIKHVMSGINPQGCQVFSFGPPSREELDHDFLWRCHKRLPERGRIGIFDRSYYEEVLVVRVEPQILLNQRIPAEHIDLTTIWQQRFDDIVNMESYLHRNGTQTIKFFLHISYREQKKRLLERIDDPEKNWKFVMNDLNSRSQWPAYQHAFAECISHTSSEHSPWYIVPADSKKNARLIISRIILKTMRELKIEYPAPSDEHLADLQHAKQILESEA